MRKYSNEPSIAISGTNSISNTPMKGIPKHHNPYNLASPFKPISDTFEMES